MKIIYEFRFFRDEFEKIKDAPTYLVTNKNDFRVNIRLGQNHPELIQLINWTKKHKKSSIGWFIGIEKKYDIKELETAILLYISWIDDAPGEMFGEDYGTKYELIKKCQQYEIRKQTTPLFCNTSKLSKNKDIQKLFSSEIIISKKLKEILERKKLTGFEIKPIYRPTKIKDWGDVDEILSDQSKQSQDYFQLIITSNCGNIASPPTVFGPDYIDLNKKHDIISYLPECNLIEDIYWESNLHLYKINWPNTDFAITKEKIIGDYPYPLIVISQKVYQILKDNNIKGLKIEPAYFT